MTARKPVIKIEKPDPVVTPAPEPTPEPVAEATAEDNGAVPTLHLPHPDDVAAEDPAPADLTPEESLAAYKRASNRTYLVDCLRQTYPWLTQSEAETIYDGPGDDHEMSLAHPNAPQPVDPEVTA